MLEAFGATDRGCVRTNNEDAFLCEPALGLFAVADGMGGAAAGERAAQIAIATLREIVVEESAEGGMNAAKLVTAVHEAHRRLRAAAQQDARLQGMGTTLVAAVEAGPRLELVSVGDSRIYVHAAGRLRQITEDQSWAREVGRRLGLTAEQLRLHPMRHVLTMALGASSELKVNAYQHALAPGERLLLCTDGLHGVVADSDIARILDAGGSLEQCARRLMDAALARGAPDNVTVVLVAQPES
jgi:protein phosphatase